MERSDLMRDVMQAATGLNSRKIMTRFTHSDCFAVRIPDRGESMLSVVLSDTGGPYGLSLFRGEKAAAFLAAILDPDGGGDDVAEEIDMMGFSVEPFGDLLPQAQTQIRKAGLHPRYDDSVPGFLVKRPGRQPRLPDEAELELLLMVLCGVIRADEEKRLEPARLDDPQGLYTLVLSGDAAVPQVSVMRERWSSPAASGGAKGRRFGGALLLRGDVAGRPAGHADRHRGRRSES